VVTPRLQHHADPGPPGFPAVRRVDAEHADLSRRPDPEALQDLDRGRLAGPVRPEQDEHLPAPRGERDSVEHIGLPVAHAQVAHVNHG
jgi:hypothetical protein